MFDIKIVANILKDIKLEIFALQFNLKDIDIPINEYGQTWLHLLSYYGNGLLVKTLLDNTATVQTTDRFGHTALHYAAMNRKTEVANLLLSKDLSINSKTLNGDTALHYASLVGHKDLMLFLLDQKADKQAVNNDGLSALHYAIAMNKIEAAQTLLNKDIKITELADKGYSVLHVASAVGDPIMTTSIIEYKGGKELVNLKDQALHWKPIHFAKLARNAEVIELLKQNGAVDTPPIFSADGVTALVESIRDTMCYPEKMVDTVTGGFAALSGATLTFGAGKLLVLDQFRFATQLATKGSIWAVNTFVVNQFLKNGLVCLLQTVKHMICFKIRIVKM
jgi:ankyrin repeat protein